MAIPIPSEERTVKERLWRAKEVRLYDGDRDLIHADAHRKQREQEVFANNDHHYLYSGLSSSEPPKRQGPKMLPPPVVRERPKREKKLVLPMTEKEILGKLNASTPEPFAVSPTWANSPFSSSPRLQLMTKRHQLPGICSIARPELDREADSFFHVDGKLRVSEHVSPQKPMVDQRRYFKEMREEQEARSRGAKGDLSLYRGGVRKVELERRCENANIPGFNGIGQFSPEPRMTGTKKVIPFSTVFDPLHYKEKYNSGHKVPGW